jgi:hypothetical protein
MLVANELRRIVSILSPLPLGPSVCCQQSAVKKAHQNQHYEERV